MDNGINLLIEALVEITNTTSNGNKGEDFESQISQILSKVGFTKCSLEFKSSISISKSLPNLSKNEYNELTKKIKDSIIEKNNIQVVKNPFSNYLNSNIYIYIYQPFGSQQFPDFLILTKNFVIPLETKFSTKNNRNELPKWNSNIPKSNSLYLFASTTKENPIMFLGSDYISNEVHNIFLDYFENFNEKDQIDNLKKKTDLLNNKYNPFGLYPKIRTDFLKRNDFVFGNEEKLNIFDFSKKMKWKCN